MIRKTGRKRPMLRPVKRRFCIFDWCFDYWTIWIVWIDEWCYRFITIKSSCNFIFRNYIGCVLTDDGYLAFKWQRWCWDESYDNLENGIELCFWGELEVSDEGCGQ